MFPKPRVETRHRRFQTDDKQTLVTLEPWKRGGQRFFHIGRHSPDIGTMKALIVSEAVRKENGASAFVSRRIHTISAITTRAAGLHTKPDEMRYKRERALSVNLCHCSVLRSSSRRLKDTSGGSRSQKRRGAGIVQNRAASESDASHSSSNLLVSRSV